MFHFIAIFLSFLVPLFGENWKDRLEFGNTLSSNEAYLFTDWLCPFCQKMEPEFEKMLPKLLEKAKVTFAVLANHEGSINYVNYDLSFMLHNRADYLKIRPVLQQLALETRNPTPEQLEKLLTPLKIKYEPLDKESVQGIESYFWGLVRSFGVTGTPTLVLRNSQTGKTKKMVGQEINEKGVIQAIEEIK